MVIKNDPLKISRDKGLVSRMYFTWFLLGILYAFFALVLNAFGVQISFIIVIVFGMGLFQYYMSDKMILWSKKAQYLSIFILWSLILTISFQISSKDIQTKKLST